VTIKYTAAGLRMANVTDEIPGKKRLAIYPNPVQNNFTVHLPGDSKYVLTITDAEGKKVFETTTDKTILLINSSSFSNGIYYVKATGTNIAFTQKIIKE